MSRLSIGCFAPAWSGCGFLKTIASLTASLKKTSLPHDALPLLIPLQTLSPFPELTHAFIFSSFDLADVREACEARSRLLRAGLSEDAAVFVLLKAVGEEGLAPGALRDVLPGGVIIEGRDLNRRLFETTQRWIAEAAEPASPSAPPDFKRLEKEIEERLWRRWGALENSWAFDVEKVREQIGLETARMNLVQEHREFLLQNVFDHMTGLGPLEKFRRDESVGEIMVNGWDEIFIEKNGCLSRSPDSFLNEIQLRTVIDRLAAGAGRRVDQSSPLCDMRMPDGSRVNVVLSPISLKGPLITIRRFKPAFATFEDLVSSGFLTVSQRDELIRRVRARDNLVIAGNSGAGKTTLLNVLSKFIPEGERIITMEDAAELQLQQPHVVRLETRPKNAEGTGEIGMSELVVNALRMRPDRLIVGECRGAEVLPMLQAMNTGHDGSMTTVHANSAQDALQRLESLVLSGAPQWPLSMARRQIEAAVDVIVYVKREGNRRRLDGLAEVRWSNDELIARPLEDGHE